jgi:5-methylcytosine-specific restriction enzyme subunit McrC
MIYSITENGLIANANQWPEPPPDGVLVPEEVFQALRRFAFENENADGFLTFSVQKGREIIRVRNYVGLLPLTPQTQLEILPKIGRDDTARSLLLCMLRHLRQSPFRTLSEAHTSAVQLPLWEVFITAFLDTAEPLIRQGIQHAYVSVDSNERFWKGKFQATRQQRDNATHAERLAVVYDARTVDVAPNRILKTALVFLEKATENPTVKRRINQLAWALADVPPTESLHDDLINTRRSTRLFKRYEPALRWAEALLQGRGYGVKAGQTPSFSLLFPMERIFEDYVAHGIRTCWPPADELRVQESSAHLVEEHAGTPKFKLRPDILIRHPDRTFVLDTKWKQINGRESGTGPGNYGIEQPDLYQLYAYGKKYEADDLFLIYPANDAFRQPLPVFGYDAATRLHVVPFDVTNSLGNEVEKLAAYALSFQQ